MIVLISIRIEIMKPIELIGLGHWLKRVFDHIVGQIKRVSIHIEKLIVELEQWLEKLFDYIVDWLGQVSIHIDLHWIIELEQWPINWLKWVFDYIVELLGRVFDCIEKNYLTKIFKLEHWHQIVFDCIIDWLRQVIVHIDWHWIVELGLELVLKQLGFISRPLLWHQIVFDCIVDLLWQVIGHIDWH